MSTGIYWKCLRCDFGHVEDECPNCGWHTRGEFDLPPQRTWVGLTEDEIQPLLSQNRFAVFALIRAIEAKLKEKNT